MAQDAYGTRRERIWREGHHGEARHAGACRIEYGRHRQRDEGIRRRPAPAARHADLTTQRPSRREVCRCRLGLGIGRLRNPGYNGRCRDLHRRRGVPAAGLLAGPQMGLKLGLCVIWKRLVQEDDDSHESERNGKQKDERP